MVLVIVESKISYSVDSLQVVIYDDVGNFRETNISVASGVYYV